MEISTFQKRKSVRRFSEKEIDKNVLTEMTKFGQNLPFLFNKLEHQLLWMQSKEAVSNVLSNFLLSYGKLVSAPYLVTPFFKEAENAELEIGFMLEHLVLKATELGLATLWLSTNEFYNEFKEEFIKLINDSENKLDARLISNNVPSNLEAALAEMQLPVVLLVGHPSEKRIDRILNNAIRMESAGNSRKKIESIILNKRNDVSIPDKIKKILNLAILAPSKKNQQPWRVRFTSDGFDLGYLHDRQMDVGIFLSHIKISMEHYKIPFRCSKLEEKSNDVVWIARLVVK